MRTWTALQVFVCTNLAIAPAYNGASRGRKHTGDEPWEQRIAILLEQAFEGFKPFGSAISAMQEATLEPDAAKALIYDIFSLPYTPVAPNKFLEVGKLYFDHATPDVSEPNRWSLHNAFTRAMRDTPLKRQVETSGELLRILTESLPLEPTFVDAN